MKGTFTLSPNPFGDISFDIIGPGGARLTAIEADALSGMSLPAPLIPGARLQWFQRGADTMLLQAAEAGNEFLWSFSSRTDTSLALKVSSNRPTFLFLYVLRGSLLIGAADNRLTMLPARYRLLHVGPVREHAIATGGGESTVIAVGVSLARLRQLYVVMRLLYGVQHSVDWRGEFGASPAVVGHLEALSGLSQAGRFPATVSLEDHVLGLFLHVAVDRDRHPRKSPVVVRDSSECSVLDEFLARHFARVEAGAAARLTIADVAGELKISQAALRRLLVRVKAGSWAGYVHRARMERAQELLLLEPPLGLLEIASRLGYSELPHFSRAFRRFTGVAPRDWRQSHGMR